MISLVNVFVSYGPSVVLRGVSLGVRAGDVVGILGANGSGKSSLLRVAAGAQLPSRGTVVREPGLRVGYVGHELGLYGDLSVLENVGLSAQSSGSGSAEAELRRAGLSENLWPRETRTLSRGQRQRVAWARAFASAPRLVVLDEPLTGLDEEGTGRLLARLGELVQSGGACLVSVHERAPWATVLTRAVRVGPGGTTADVSRETS